MWHDFVYHVFCLSGNSIDDVAEAVRLGNMMDEENQSYDGSEREDQGAGNSRYRSERLRQAARCGQRGHAVKERSQEDSKSPLGHSISDEAHEDARRELHRGERQSHQENREHDRDNGHDRTRDRRQHDLSDLGIGTRWKQRVRDPGAYDWEALLER